MNAIARGLRGVGLDLCLERIHQADQLSLTMGQIVALVERGDGQSADLYCIDFVDPAAMDRYSPWRGAYALRTSPTRTAPG